MSGDLAARPAGPGRPERPAPPPAATGLAVRAFDGAFDGPGPGPDDPTGPVADPPAPSKPALGQAALGQATAGQATAGELLSPELVGRVGDYARAARSGATWRAYDSDLRQFRAWCARQTMPLCPLPATPATVAGYLATLADAGYKPSTIRRRLAAISVAHQLGRHDNPAAAPEVAAVWDGIRRTRGTRPNRKAALDTSLLAQVVAPLRDDVLADVRDRALLLIGFAGCLRRSELVALDVADLTETPDGVVLTIRSSKTDQEGAGALVGVAYGSYRPTCPVRAWQAWARTADLGEGPAFRAVNRHGRVAESRLYPGSVARIVQRRVAAAGLDPADFAGHSLRSGFATAAARAGVADRSIMRQGRWRSSTSLDGYVRAGRLFDRENPSGRVGL